MPDEDGEATAVPCAEAVLTERALEALRELGLTPLISLRDSDRVRLETLRGPDDPQLAITTANLGFLKADIEELDEAEALLERAAIRLQSMPSQRQTLVTVLEGLRQVQERAGRKAAAKKTGARVAEARARVEPG